MPTDFDLYLTFLFPLSSTSLSLSLSLSHTHTHKHQKHPMGKRPRDPTLQTPGKLFSAANMIRMLVRLDYSLYITIFIITCEIL